MSLALCTLLLYILIFLHQTATALLMNTRVPCCISLYSYIKPQPPSCSAALSRRCISLYSYIKPQPAGRQGGRATAVYPYIPTSNRNSQGNYEWTDKAVYPYIPTSNRNGRGSSSPLAVLYILIFLHQTATTAISSVCRSCCISLYSYIKPQLYARTAHTSDRCISLYSYIKPQLNLWELLCTKGNTLYPRNKKRKRRSIFHCKVTKKVPIV